MMGQCIYCPYQGDLSKEHYLPAALGDFKGYELLLERVCQTCNNHIGKTVETEFLRTGAIGFFRWMLGGSGPHSAPRSPFYNREAGIDPILMTGRAPGFDYELFFEVEPGTENAYPLCQAVFEHPLFEKPRAVPIHARVKGHPEELQALLHEMGLDTARLTRVFATDDEIPWVRDLMEALGHTFPTDWSVTSLPAGKIPLVAEVRVSPAHFRAVAKIGFHYTLKMFPYLTGQEPQFDPIRKFILEGVGNPDQFVVQRRDQFVKNFGSARPTHWMHILAVEKTYGSILAHAQFFAGPGMLPPPYAVQIGRNPARIATHNESRAHQFVLLDPARMTGVMEDAQPVQFIKTL